MQLNLFFQESKPFIESLKAFFSALNIRINSLQDKPYPLKDVLKQRFKVDNEVQRLINEVYFLGIMSDKTFEEATLNFDQEDPQLDELREDGKDYQGMAIFGITLHTRDNSLLPTRSQLAELTRLFNQAFPTLPVTIVFRYGQHLAIANCERMQYSKRSGKLGEKTGRVSLLRDIKIENTHTGHLRILEDMKMPTVGKEAVRTFASAKAYWSKVFDTRILNNNFYQEISKWFDWVTDTAVFNDENDQKTKSLNTIKIINRLLFIWFLKEKDLISKNLFNEKFIKSQLNDELALESNSYYVGVLSNLFFNTVNEKIENRFKKFDVISSMLFKDFEVIKQELNKSPFVNGGLFDATKADFCTTVQETATLKLPNKYFFGEHHGIDLSKHYSDSKNHRNETIYGLVDLLNRYKFTVEENTPYDVEIALDPELLGKIFENLLASYNEETKSTARKATGSYYTPREIVEYMVDQSLILYLQNRIFPNYSIVGTTTNRTGGFGKTTGLPQSDLFGEVKPVQKTLEDAFREVKKAEPRTILPTSDIDTGGINKFKDELNSLLDYAALETVSDEFKTLYRDKVLDALDKLKILDPAIGSGAFPMGILQKITLLLKRLDPNNKRWLQRMLGRIPNSQIRKATEEKWANENTQYLRKLGIIESSIYGIDLQPLAVQISKLRFFISLVIEQNINKDASKNYGIEPLPNLDFKFICTNTLIEAPVPAITNEIKDIMNKFKQNVSTYFTAIADDKKVIKDKILKNIDEFIKINNTYIKQLIEQIRKEGASGSPAKAKKAKEKMTQLQYASELWHSYSNIFEDKPIKFFKTEYLYPDVAANEGFDIIIANPPYIKEYTYKEAFDGIRKSPYYMGKMDLWNFFACHNLDLLKKETGILTYIAPNNWTTNAGAYTMREKVVQKTKIEQMIDFGSYMIFESADIQTMIMIFRNTELVDNYTFDLRRLISPNPVFNDVLNALHKTASSSIEYLSPRINKEQFNNKNLTFSNSHKSAILEKILNKGSIRLTLNEVANGIHPHYDYVNKNSLQILGNAYKVGQGIFVLNTQELNLLKLQPNEYNLIKPYYTTAQLKKWGGEVKNLEWIIYTTSEFKNPKAIASYPNIKKHLDQFSDVITSDNKPYGLHRAREEYFFKGEKIIALRKCVGEPIFTYTDFDCYVSATFYIEGV